MVLMATQAEMLEELARMTDREIISAAFQLTYLAPDALRAAIADLRRVDAEIGAGK